MKNQKENILQVATELFYEKGYKATYLGEIAERCEITKPLITYYFKSKSQLAGEVGDKMVIDLKNRVALKLYVEYFKDNPTDLQVSTAVEIRLFDMMHLYDEKVMRFARERADDRFADNFTKANVYLYKIHDRHYGLNLKRCPDEISMIAHAAMSSSLAVKLAYDSGEFDCTADECLDYLTSLHFTMMHIDESRIDEIISESKRIHKLIPFEIKPYFKVE
ncbi:helix-turn-helix domain-containing protein [Eubacteriaceae bacterium ES3]|nr:helix-turn-helix domain-containing protein [Eubacteriaceae bacterium ES3]